jgi:hypothetical protein
VSAPLPHVDPLVTSGLRRFAVARGLRLPAGRIGVPPDPHPLVRLALGK